MRRLAQPTRRQAAATAALGLTGLSAYAATRYSARPTAAPMATAARSSGASTAHAADFIPSADAPRIDGRLTLIWFSEPE